MAKQGRQVGRSDLPKKIAKGAAGVAVAAGVVAAGAALMDEETRNKIGEKAGNFMEDQAENYQKVAHEVGRVRSKTKKSRGK